MRQTVLVIDSDTGALEKTTELLQERGLDVIPAGTVEQVRDALSNGPPRVVLVEPVLEGADGFELCRTILESFPDSPPILLTASHRLSGKAPHFRAKEVGAHLFLERPERDSVLVEAVVRGMTGPTQPARGLVPAIPTTAVVVSRAGAPHPTTDPLVSIVDSPGPVEIAVELTPGAAAGPATLPEPHPVAEPGARKGRGYWAVAATGLIGLGLGAAIVFFLARGSGTPVVQNTHTMPEPAVVSAPIAPEGDLDAAGFSEVEIPPAEGADARPEPLPVAPRRVTRNPVPDASASAGPPVAGTAAAQPIVNKPAAAFETADAPIRELPARVAETVAARPLPAVVPPPPAVPDSTGDPRPPAQASETAVEETAALETTTPEPTPMDPVFPRESVDLLTGLASKPISVQTVAEPEPPAPTAPPEEIAASLIPGSRVEPTYPPIARRLKVNGRVLLEVTVRPDGSVGAVDVLQEPGPRYGMGQAAVDAVKRWRYRPATVDGEAVESVVVVAIAFRAK